MNDLFNVEVSSGRPQLPTLRKFLEDKGDNKLPPYFVVKEIFLPNEYPNITIGTTHFRCHVYENSDLYTILPPRLEELANQECCLIVRLSESDRRVFALDQLEGERSAWESINDLGYRLRVLDKPSKRRKR